MSQKITIDFFHDSVCSWCYLLSPQLKNLADEIPLDIRHHTFTLSATKAEMINHFGSAAKAKETILSHWQQVTEYDPDLLINVEGMRKQAFDYPHGGPAALACKAAEAQGGSSGHWRYFDRVQRAHFHENRNIADVNVLLDLAEELGLDLEAFTQDFHSQATMTKVKQDQLLAYKWGISSVPTLVVNQRWRLPGTTSIEHLKAMLLEAKEA